MPEAIDDATIPVNDFIMEKAGRPIGNLRDQVAEAMESMDPSEVHVAAPPSAAASKKRGRPADEPGGEGGEDGEGSASKRRAGADKPESLDDIPIFAQAGKLKRATIPQLTAYIKANGIKARGNKQNLMEGILKHLGLEHVEQD